MYHSISKDMRMGGHPYFEVCTSPEVFSNHMRFLHDNGYTSVALNEVVSILAQEKAAPPKPVCITFDDGFRDFLTSALPILNSNGLSATVFLATGFVNNEKANFNGRKCLAWDEVRYLRSEGIAFGSHSVNHKDLTRMSLEELKSELQDSKQIIESKLGEVIDCFSYPYAFPEAKTRFLQVLRRCLVEAGYKCCCTTTIGTAFVKSNPLSLPRVPINEFDDMTFFRAKVEGGYDWVRNFQKTSKMLAGVTG
jgi:peptidoglycan/xylan/chitin deacetylase (PgdA/CDA1 family)